jgi:hypothetical protein
MMLSRLVQGEAKTLLPIRLRRDRGRVGGIVIHIVTVIDLG